MTVKGRTDNKDSPVEPFWKRLWLKTFDDPETRTGICGVNSVKDWADRMQKVVRAANSITKQKGESSDLKALINLLHLSSPSIDGCPHTTLNVAFINSIWQSSPELYAFYVPPLRFLKLHDEGPNSLSLTVSEPSEITSPERMLQDPASCELSCHFGLPSGENWSSANRSAARARVYNLNSYRRGTFYGPFTPASSAADIGQRVDFLQLEAIMVVILSNANEMYNRHFGYECTQSMLPLGLFYARPFTIPRLPESTPTGDWAGVTGRWRRAISYLDYRDLFMFHLRRLHGTNALIPADEAVVLLALELQVSKIGSEDDPPTTDYPTIHFVGRSEGGTPHESRVRGTVSKMLDGNIRWCLTSNYAGEDRWSSVGVQVGGQQSGAGVLGIWTGVDHALEDPAGPFWLWKRRDTDEDSDNDV